MIKFEVGLTWELEEGVDAWLVVSGRAQPALPPTKPTMNDPWGEPGLEGYMERIEIRNRQGCRLPKAVEDRLTCDSDFLQAVEDRIAYDN